MRKALAVAADSDITRFSTPADQQDLAATPAAQAQLDELWSQVLEASTSAARVGNPWTNCNDADRRLYFDPLAVAPTGASTVAINWNAFPNRLNVYFGTAAGSPYGLSQLQLFQLADQGKLPDVPDFAKGFPTIPSQICPSLDWQQDKSQWQAFGPSGPRGWLDEYCEFAVERDSSGEIRRIHFTCENPEYWFSLWRISPQAVANIYSQVLGAVVNVDDLSLRDENGQIITDPLTGQPVYNPLNDWNCGTQIANGVGGAMHLTSPPNTIGAEIYLGAAATLQRNLPPQQYNAQGLVCCSQYGQPFRNSDPHIGFNVNQLVKNANMQVTLADPVGLYIQTPDFSQVKISGGIDPSTLWRVVRGRNAQQAGTSYDQILHAVFEIPPGIVPSRDITVAGEPLQWASQIQQTFHIALAAWGMPNSGPAPQAEPCVSSISAPNPWPQLILDNQAMENYDPDAPLVNVPPVIKAGQTATQLALLVVDGDKNALIQCDDPAVAITVTGGYVPPGGGAAGKTGVFSTYVYVIDISIGADAQPGEKGIVAVNPGNQPGPACPGLLIVDSAS